MQTTRLSSKGQIILPKSVRDAHHWEPGTEFAVEPMGDGVILRPVKSVAHSRLEDVAGCLRVSGPPRSIAEMDAAIVSELRRRRDRGRY
jgi:AbrB family looped-hinge helix DNA binding protein